MCHSLEKLYISFSSQKRTEQKCQIFGQNHELITPLKEAPFATVDDVHFHSLKSIFFYLEHNITLFYVIFKLKTNH